MATTLTSKGQVTIPKRIRDALGLKPGHRWNSVWAITAPWSFIELRLASHDPGLKIASLQVAASPKPTGELTS